MNKLWMTAAGAAALVMLAACGQDESADGQPADGAAAQSPQNEARAVSVRARPVQQRSLQAWIYSQGTARSRQREFLTFTQEGLVSYVDPELRVGSPVKQGHLIAHQAPERVQADLQAARASLAEAQASLRLAETTRKRYETLTQQRSASKQELDEAVVQVEQARATRDNARAQLAQAELGVAESRLVSPIDGVLARLNIERGRYFSPNAVQVDSEQSGLRTVPAMVIDPNQFEVRVDLPAYDFQRIREGARAVIGGNPPADGTDQDPLAKQDVRQGRVHAVSPSLDPETRTFEVIVHTDGLQSGLQDGAFVAVWIAEPGVEEAVAVPLDALRFRNDQSYVFVLDRDSGKVAERRIELGQQAGSYRAVVDGLKADEWVVTDGRAALQDGQQVRVLDDGEAARQQQPSQQQQQQQQQQPSQQQQAQQPQAQQPPQVQPGQAQQPRDQQAAPR